MRAHARRWWHLLVQRSSDAARQALDHYRRLLAWLDAPENARRALIGASVVLGVIGLVVPPFSLLDRLTSRDHKTLAAAMGASVAAEGGGASLEVGRRDIYQTTRVRVARQSSLPSGVLPEAGYERMGDFVSLDWRGPLPYFGKLTVNIGVPSADQPFVDALGWDGRTWRWLASDFVSEGRIEIELPLRRFSPSLVMLARAPIAATSVSAVLLPAPAQAPAAVAELPILEMSAYRLADDTGRVAGTLGAVPSRKARVYGVVANSEPGRWRPDLVTNMLIRPASRARHRDELVRLVRRDGLAGVVLDYRDLDADLQGTYQDWLGRLADDLHRAGARLVVAVPMPVSSSSGWSESPANWQAMAASCDGLRVLLPDDAPLEISTLASLVEWAVRRVDRRKLQLAVPVQGRDVTAAEGAPEVRQIGYAEALSKVLDLAASDAPPRISPGETATVNLPTLSQAELVRDPAVGMWRFYYWDDLRRKHTVWLNDALGLKPAFDIAARFGLAQIVLDGVSAGLDPVLWEMTQGFLKNGNRAVAPPPTEYRIHWQLVDVTGQVVQEAFQPLSEVTFEVHAPPSRGNYRLGINLVTQDGRVAALGDTADIAVAEAPPPTPEATVIVIRDLPTSETIVTAPPPLDEARIRRTPVSVAGGAITPTPGDYDGSVSFANAELRSGPGITYSVVSNLRVGERFIVGTTSDDRRWLQVTLTGTGVDGWVLAQLVMLRTEKERAASALTPTAPPASRVPPSSAAKPGTGRAPLAEATLPPVAVATAGP